MNRYNVKNRIRALIIDDERLAREGLRLMLKADSDVEIVGECSDGVQAIEQIQEKQPDVIFLDVQMPEVDGFDVIEALDEGRKPAVIFVTAYDKYALDAFKVHAMDYLLKPVDPVRFHDALLQVKSNLRDRTTTSDDKISNLLRYLEDHRTRSARIIVKSGGRIFFVHENDIDWVEAADDYVQLHTRSGKHIVRERMNTLAGRLNPEKFIRIHRSTIVNVERIKELEPAFRGEYTVHLHDGAKLAMSKTYREQFVKKMKGTL